MKMNLIQQKTLNYLNLIIVKSIYFYQLNYFYFKANFQFHSKKVYLIHHFNFHLFNQIYLLLFFIHFLPPLFLHSLLITIIKNFLEYLYFYFLLNLNSKKLIFSSKLPTSILPTNSIS
jgi:hypothetical protein